jgi:hypothetical protein
MDFSGATPILIVSRLDLQERTPNYSHLRNGSSVESFDSTWVVSSDRLIGTYPHACR